MKLTDRLYQSILDDDEDARACKDIDDQACREVPGNATRIVATQLLTKLGDHLANTKTVLPWLLNSIGVPAVVTGLLVPIRESGSLIPQLFIGGWVRQYSIRKWFFTAGCCLQALCVAGMASTAWLFTGWTAGIIVLGLMIVFSLARGLCSVVSKDVLGKTIPKQRRGRVSGLSASMAGALSIGAGLWLMLPASDQHQYLIGIVFAASACWLIAALLFAQVMEFAGATDGGENAIKLALKNSRLLVTDAPFRLFVITRALMMSSGLVAPFWVMSAQAQHSQHSLLTLGGFILTAGVAGLCSGLLWGKWADRNSRAVMTTTALLTCLWCITMTAIVWLGLTVENVAIPVWLYLLLFFLLSATHAGVRLGRKTYIVDLAGGNKRTDYVSVSNSMIGILLLAVGVFTALLSQWSLMAVFIIFAITSAIAVWTSRSLPSSQSH